MNIKIHTTGGHSFKELAAYLMHDDNAELSDRVKWTETRNLATQNPEVAWRVMAATAMNQKQLKKAAGISPGGRKPGGSVIHLSISWKDEEAVDRNLNRKEMMRLVDTVLANYGATKPQRSQYADEHQALVVCHRDKKHPHVHVVVNRTHPEHGVYLPDGNDYLKVSGTALNYERESGRIWSPKREVNWSQRERKQYAKYHEEPRNVWQANRDASITQKSAVADAVRAQKSPDAELHRQGRNLSKRHREAWLKLSFHHQNRVSRIEAETQHRLKQVDQKIADEFAPQWVDRFNAKEAAFGSFIRNEGSVWGRLKNRLETVDFGQVLTARNRLRVLRVVAENIVSNAARRKTTIRQERIKERELAYEQEAAEVLAKIEIYQDRKDAIASNRDRFLKERAELIEAQSQEKADLREQWKQRNQERKQALTSASAPRYKINREEAIVRAKRIQEREAAHAQQKSKKPHRNFRM